MDLQRSLLPLTLVVVSTLIIAITTKGRVRRLAVSILLFRAWLLIFVLLPLLSLVNFWLFIIIPLLSTVGFFLYYRKTQNPTYKYFSFLTLLFLLSFILRALGVENNFGPYFLWIPFIVLVILFVKDKVKAKASATVTQ